MQRTLSYSPTRTSGLEFDSPTFDVVIAYEDFEAGTHAKRTYDFLIANLGRDCRFSNQMWKFDVLNISKLREIAVKDAANADIIIISNHGDELPVQVKQWIESWTAAPGNPLALVALFEQPRDLSTTCATREYLAGVARGRGMEFFAQPDVGPSDITAGPLLFDHASELSQRTLSRLTGAVQRSSSISHWGINE